MKRLAITGSSGYLGSKLVEYFRQRDSGIRILGVDLREPTRVAPDQFLRLDILSSELGAALVGFAPDTIIHGAFAFQPMRDERRMREINVEGSRNVLRAAGQSRPRRLLVVSSATAYGAWPDNPVPLDESAPLRARHEFRYAADKTELEQLVQSFAAEHAEIAVSCVRPALVGGPQMDNYLSRFIFGMPFLVRIDGCDTPLQFVHEADVAAAIHAILCANGRGAYNLAPPDWSTISEIAQATNRRVFSLPFWLVYATHWLAWTSRLPIHESPASFLYFVRYPWVVAPHRLTRELGYKFQFSSRDTLREIIQHTRQTRRSAEPGAST